MIYIIRHTEKDRPIRAKNENYSSYTMNIGLAKDGVIRAEKIANYLMQNANITKIISSRFARAIQTAEIIGKLLDVETSVDRRLDERTLCADKISIETVNRYNEISLNDWGWAAPGGESMVDVSNRVHDLISELNKTELNGDILLVSHSRALQAFIGNTGKNKYAQHLREEPSAMIEYGEILKINSDRSIKIHTKIK